MCWLMRDTRRNPSQKLEQADGIISFQPFFFSPAFSKASVVPSAEFQTRKFTHGRKSAVIKRLLPSAGPPPFPALGEGDLSPTMCSEFDFSPIQITRLPSPPNNIYTKTLLQQEMRESCAGFQIFV